MSLTTALESRSTPRTMPPCAPPPALEKSTCCSTNGVAARTPFTCFTRSTIVPDPATPCPPVWKINRCGFAAMILSRIASWNPVITANTSMSAATPRKTPPTPIQTKSERFVRWPRDRR